MESKIRGEFSYDCRLPLLEEMRQLELKIVAFFGSETDYAY